MTSITKDVVSEIVKSEKSMRNSRLTVLKSFIGKPFKGSPSAFGNWLNGEVVSIESDSVEFQFTVTHDMTNPVGILHGGIVSAMIDDCIGINFFVLDLEYFYPTINLNVEFFSSAQKGEKIRVKTQLVKQGKTIINLNADVFNSDQKLLAKATSNLAVSNIKIPF